jgi:hypothetical protein
MHNVISMCACLDTSQPLIRIRSCPNARCPSARVPALSAALLLLPPMLPAANTARRRGCGCDYDCDCDWPQPGWQAVRLRPRPFARIASVLLLVLLHPRRFGPWRQDRRAYMYILYILYVHVPFFHLTEVYTKIHVRYTMSYRPIHLTAYTHMRGHTQGRLGGRTGFFFCAAR